MEKKTVIAFVLSFLVLILWSYFFTPKQEKKPPEVAKVGEKEASLAEPAQRALPQKPTPSAVTQKREEAVPSSETREREITVDTPLFRAVFTNVDAVIKSFKLKNYRLTTDPESPMVELVSLENRQDNFISVSFESHRKSKGEKIIYQVEDDFIRLNPESPPRDLTFRAQTPEGVSISQTFRFYPDRYPIDLLVDLENNSQEAIDGNLRATMMNMPPKSKKSYYSFVGMALLLNDKLEEIKPKDLEKDGPFSGKLEWMAYESDQFMAAVIPENPSKATFEGRSLSSGAIRGGFLGPLISLPPLGRGSSGYTLYMGPRDLDILKQLNKKLDLAINFGWTDIIAKPLHYTLRFFNKYVNNYGVSIILLTVLIKIIFWPLTHKSYKSMKEMQKLQPLMAKIREKHKGSKEQMNKELMGLYKTYKVNPMGGCLPMVIQIPVFFALFRILGNSIELRHAPFIFWINDLSAPDRLFNFPFDIPFMSPPYGIPVLTLLMGASMFLQQKMTPTPGDPTQAKVMMFLPLIFTVMFINFPSGLVLYWLTNNLLSIGQQYRIKKSQA